MSDKRNHQKKKTAQKPHQPTTPNLPLNIKNKHQQCQLTTKSPNSLKLLGKQNEI